MEEKKLNDKNKKLIAIAVIMIAVLALGYFVLSGSSNELEGQEQEQEVKEVSFTRQAHLFRAGTDGELGARNEGEAVFEFNPGDYLGISGTYEVTETTRINYNLLDENQGVLSPGFLPSFTAYETEGSSGFSGCCAGVPNREGSYMIEVLVGSDRADLIPFEVVAK